MQRTRFYMAMILLSETDEEMREWNRQAIDDKKINPDEYNYIQLAIQLRYVMKF